MRRSSAPGRAEGFAIATYNGRNGCAAAHSAPMKKLSVLLIALIAVLLWWSSRPSDRSIDTESSRQGSEIERPRDDDLAPLEARMAPLGASDDRASGLNESASDEVMPSATSNPPGTEDRSISGRVLFADGTPLAGHRVIIGSNAHNNIRHDAVVVLDAGGSFEARELEEDTYTVWIASYQLGEQGEKHDVPVPTEDLEFKIDALALTILPPSPSHSGDRSGSMVRTRFNAFGTERRFASTGSKPWPLREAVQRIVPRDPATAWSSSRKTDLGRPWVRHSNPVFRLARTRRDSPSTPRGSERSRSS